MLYRRSDSEFWWVRFKGPDRKEIRQSTGTANRKDAEEFEAQLKLARWRQVRMGDRPRRTWQEAVVRWVEETNHKRSHLDDLWHIKWLDSHLRDKHLDEINRDTLDGISRFRRKEGASPARTNRTMALVRSILRKAEREWEWLEKAPAVRMLPESKRRVRWLTHEEADRLLSELPEHLADMARFTLATGLRDANVTGMQWNQIDMARRVAWIHADEFKTGKPLAVPLNSEAIEVIRRQIGKHLVFVFTYHGEPVTRANNHAWQKALKRAGIENFRWHDLRHTWASWHVQAGTQLHVLQELGGWQSYEMVRRYAHLSADHLADAAASLVRNPTNLNPARKNISKL
ncbi:single-strand DNA-binding protein [Gammaproteobacteria bacterium]